MDIMLELKRALRRLLSDDVVEALKQRLKALTATKRDKEVDALYRLLYEAVHDYDQSLMLTTRQTVDTFRFQWSELPEGRYMLSNPWFKENIRSILCEQLLLLKPEWFQGKSVMDAGCGGGRWSHGLASLGANVTSVDINDVAIESAKKAMQPFDVVKNYCQTPLEELDKAMGEMKYDLVFSYGVIHHCGSFNKSFGNVVDRVADDGVLFLYLYGRETIPYEQDIELFKDRVYYNSLPTSEERYQFLLNRTHGRPEMVHEAHDHFAPLVNRRHEFEEIRERLEALGFEDIMQTMDTTDLYIRAFKKGGRRKHEESLLPKPKPPFWFDHHEDS